MDIIGGRKFVELPGDEVFQLPPLLLGNLPTTAKILPLIDKVRRTIESEDIISETVRSQENAIDFERRSTSLSVELVEQYITLFRHWKLGADVLHWIDQCETTFEFSNTLRNILRPDLWPHAGKNSFVTLLADKKISTQPYDLPKAIGLRLMFTQMPKISCFDHTFLFLLKDTTATSSYQTWCTLSPEPVSHLPPERFAFDVYKL